MQKVLRIKPHHFLDIIRDFGAGVKHGPHPYGHAVHLAAGILKEEPETLLELTSRADSICAPCSHLVRGRCTDTTFTPGRMAAKGSWNRLIDRRLFKRLGLREGDRLSAREFCRLAQERLGELDSIYPEVDRKRTAERKANLTRGLEEYLKSRPDN